MATTTTAPLIYWFRRDLRLHDLPALNAAADTGQPLVAVYILDDETPGAWTLGAASRWWLHHSLAALDRSLGETGGGLLFRQGRAVEQLLQLAATLNAGSIYFSRQYDPWSAAEETALEQACRADGIECRRFRGALLHEPEEILNQSGNPFRVFTPFWKACRSRGLDSPPQSAPAQIHFHAHDLETPALESLGLLTNSELWARHWTGLWQPGETGAGRRLDEFIESGLEDYAEGRDFPARRVTSLLSPHLHFGELSPRQLWQEAQAPGAEQPALQPQSDKFLAELGWREFAHHLLYHFPQLPERAFNRQFDSFPWREGRDQLRAWQHGNTGYPIVDAGMRELWQTGYMHNRVRMIAASFLTKHLLLPWQLGQQWFWDTLVDADLANNACGWQWVAGSGADAAPYFRIFNPTLQGQKFDADGGYVRRWVPELAALPDRYLHEPSTAPATVLRDAGISLGSTYPVPIVEHRVARQRALDALAQNRRTNEANQGS